MAGYRRKTSQHLLPLRHPGATPGSYDIYPAHPLPEGEIFTGFATLADELMKHPVVLIDGYIGVFFEDIKEQLIRLFETQNISSSWIDISVAMLPETEICSLTAPFLGGDDPLFGTRTTLTLSDFFDARKLTAIQKDDSTAITVVYGCGASLCGLKGFTVYADLPKNELQFRARAGAVTNLGRQKPGDPKAMYKQFYFVDWVVLNRHKQMLLPMVDLLIDAQRPDEITWIKGAHLRKAMQSLSSSVFRVRPWFEPGTWGGNWMLRNIDGLNPDVPNYAWSFELIVPENGLLLSHNNSLLEVSFDTLMFLEAEAVQGDAYQEFGTDFPIRFDFLDTFHGGNLSVQCHPQKEYTKKHFNENFTQEETYYILDAAEDATVYLGFQEDINPEAFEQALLESFAENREIDIEKYVKKLPARKHDLFLIPPGTVHASGINNLVLEISSTPYIFTFKMYDWVRPDLDGKPRPLNIKRAMENLCFDRRGAKVEQELVCRPELIREDETHSLFHLKTHARHLYDVHRIHLKSTVVIPTEGKFMVFSLVEGSRVSVTSRNGITMHFNYAETFVVPAAAGFITLANLGEGTAILVKAFVK